MTSPSSQLFVCGCCGCVDMVGYAYGPGQMPSLLHEQKCTFCQTGEWHDDFPRVKWDPVHDTVINRPS